MAGFPDKYDVFTLGAGFPPGLKTADPSTDIEPDETPDGYNFNLDKDGRLAKNVTIPTGSSRIQKSIDITEGALTVPYLWHYRRLWNITGRTASTAATYVVYGAQDYDAILFKQRNGRIDFNEDAQTILALVPFGDDSLFVAKSTGGYVLTNLSDTRAFFQRSDIIQELATSAAANIIELDGAIYVSNANGIFAYAGGKTVEISRKVRDDTTNFASKALTADYEKKRIIGDSSFVYEPNTKKLFKYTGSGFRYTSRQIHTPDWRPFSVGRLIFIIEQADENGGWFNYQVKYEDEPWTDDQLVNVDFESEEFTRKTEDLAQERSVHRFQLRITDMSTNLYIKEIRVDQKTFNADDYST